jgi:hypothetical protein
MTDIEELRARVEALEAGAICPHVVTSDESTSYCGLAEQVANSQPTSNDRQIRSSLVEQVAAAIADDGCAVDVWYDISRTAIREVAEWLRAERFVHAADFLRQEVQQ